MPFLDELQKQTNKTVTENGAVTNRSTLDPVLDFFSLAGAMRGDIPGAARLFERAYDADRTLALRTLFYLRDVRGGQGERELFRALMRDVQRNDDMAFMKLAPLIPTYGRWDDLLTLYDAAPGVVAEIVGKQLAVDVSSLERDDEQVSLMAKWLPSENASSRKSAELARKLAARLGMKPSRYRKTVVKLRKRIKLLEQQMSAREWSDIDYSRLPSQAQRKHIKAFKRHDEARYTTYLEQALNGEAKMNTATLYTYEVFDTVKAGNTKAAEAMWANLPDYTNGTDALVVADVSGSMNGRPMSVSVSLALYFAERNGGIFKDCFMTFSERPQLLKLPSKGALAAKLRAIESSDWGMNTNLEAVFYLILNAALQSGEGQAGMPKVLYIISDMEFDQATRNPDATIFDNAQKAFTENGLKLPHVVFWNVNAHQVQTPATKFDNRVTLVSGLSQSTFRYAVEGKTPRELMESVLNSDRYATIEV